MYNNNKELIAYLVKLGVLKTPNFIKSFLKIDRKFFIPNEFAKETYIDAPLPIGKNQTISQPSTVAFMLELLKPKENEKILDIGSGSGWTTALLCNIVGNKGTVIGLERVEELVNIGQKNFSKFNFGKNCKIEKAKKNIGIQGAKFDKISDTLIQKEEYSGFVFVPLITNQ